MPRKGKAAARKSSKTKGPSAGNSSLSNSASSLSSLDSVEKDGFVVIPPSAAGSCSYSCPALVATQFQPHPTTAFVETPTSSSALSTLIITNPQYDSKTMRKVKVFHGQSCPELAALILERLGVSAAPVSLEQIANKEVSVELETSVRDDDVFIIQSGSESINDSLMELLIMISACKAAAARRITAVIPYFPYNKQSKKKGRGAITAKLVANMLGVAGVDHIITLDLHSNQIQGFFNKPVDNLVAEPTIAKFISEQLAMDKQEGGVIISKNSGAAKRVTSLADRLNLDFALIHRERVRVEKKKKEFRKKEFCGLYFAR